MNVEQVLFHWGDLPVTAGRLAFAVGLLALSAALALAVGAYFKRRLLWPGSAGGSTVHILLAAFRIELLLGGVLAALAALGINVLPVVWVLLGLAALVALSWRSTSEQIWAGLLILWERPFALGERIRVGKYEGEVERVGLRTTTLRTEERLALHVPNSYLAAHAIHNRSRTEGGFGLRIPVEVMAASDSGEVIACLRRAAERNNRVRSSPSPKAFMTGFSPRGLKFELRVWVDAYTDATWATNELCRAIQSEFQRSGVTLVGAKPAAAMGPAARPARRSTRVEFDHGRDKRPDRSLADRPARSERHTSRPAERSEARRAARSEFPIREESHEVRLREVSDSAGGGGSEVEPELPPELPAQLQEAPAVLEREAPATFVTEERPDLVEHHVPSDEPSPTYGRSKRKIPRR